MKCTKCGVWSSVLATREVYGGLITRRDRKCANDHRFSTYEIHANMFGCVKSRLLNRAGSTILRRWKLQARNDAIKKELVSGAKQSELAVKYKVSISLISLIHRNKL